MEDNQTPNSNEPSNLPPITNSPASQLSRIEESEKRILKEEVRIAKSNNRIQFLLFISSVASVFINIYIVNLSSTMSDLTHSQIRAYVMPTYTYTSAEFEPSMGFSIELKNFGQTPAINLFSYSKVILGQLYT